MARFPDISAGFKLLREIDLNKIRQRAEAGFQVAVIGDSGSGKSTLINQLRSDQHGQCISNNDYTHEYCLDDEIVFQPNSLAILLLDSTRTGYAPEKKVFEKLAALKVPVAVCINKSDLLLSQRSSLDLHQWDGTKAVPISAVDRKSLLKEFVPLIVSQCRGWEVPLARHLPLFREHVSRRLIEDTCFINASYSLGTGLVEIMPLLSVPLNAADMVVLTKNQAFMAYQISLVNGLPADWKQTMPKLAAVVGSGFLWRQVARQLVGLVPALGIVFKVSVSYAGTYAVGRAIYQWCTRGEKFNPEELKLLYKEAMERGRTAALTLIQRRHRPKAREKEIDQLPDTGTPVCPSCRKEIMEGARFCAFCGEPLPA